MKYNEKIRFLIEREQKNDYDTEKYFVDVLGKKPMWESGELENIVQSYAYVPKDYIEFAREFDALGLSFVTFYSSAKGGRLRLKEQIDEFREFLKENYFPFAKDADGSVYAFATDQSVVLFDIDDYEFQNPQKISDNFVEFVDEYVLGPKCSYNLMENNDFANYLKSLGWF